MRAEFRLKSPHLEHEEAKLDSWEASFIANEEAAYVGESLVDILGKVHLQLTQSGSQLAHPQSVLASGVYDVDDSEPHLPESSGNDSSTEVLVEHI